MMRMMPLELNDHSYSVVSSCLTENGNKKWKELDNIMQTFMREQRIPGASIAISKNREILYTQGYGSAGASKRVHPDCLFRIASISKPITAFAILHLCIDHEISLDAKVFGKKGILKNYKYQDKRVPSITIRYLLQHSAGWDRDIAGDLAFVRPTSVARCHPESVEHNHVLLAFVLKKRLQFKPGTRHAYSNLCYLVLGLVIEMVTGVSFDAYLSGVLKRWDITGIKVGGPWRAGWTSTEVEYFNNREPEIVPSLNSEYGEVLPQYGGLAMGSAAAYGGLISNGTSLLHFIHLIEDLVFGNCNVEYYIEKSRHFNILSRLVKESLMQPKYEAGLDWYGLGWDVEDTGKSWGHTGGMEGTSGVLFHHSSGFSWALLLNAWAKDTDLNGIVKYGISQMPSLKLFDCDIMNVAEIDCSHGSNEDDDGGVNRGSILFSNDRSQVIVLGVDEWRAYVVTSWLKDKGYMLTWVTSTKNGVDCCPGTPWEECLNEEMNYCQAKGNSNSKSEQSQFILLFSMQSQLYNNADDYLLMLNKSKEDLLFIFNEKEQLGYLIDFIDSFCVSGGELRFSFILKRTQLLENPDCKRFLHLGLKAAHYVRQVKIWIKSHNVLCQSVTEVGSDLYVSALLEVKINVPTDTTTRSCSSYWVQIEPESFLAELKRKIKQKMNLVYAKFFNASNQSWVSGIWAHEASTYNIYHRINMSKYGLFPEIAEAAAKNVHLLNVSEYQEDGVVYYAGLWIANM